jgi:hypothetical protein
LANPQIAHPQIAEIPKVSLTGDVGGAAQEKLGWLGSFLFSRAAQIHPKQLHIVCNRWQAFYVSDIIRNSYINCYLPLCLASSIQKR